MVCIRMCDTVYMYWGGGGGGGGEYSSTCNLHNSPACIPKDGATRHEYGMVYISRCMEGL